MSAHHHHSKLTTDTTTSAGPFPATREAHQTADGATPKKLKRGYYFKTIFGDLEFLGATAARACKRIPEEYQPGYVCHWIDFMMGYDVHGEPAWSNLDQADHLYATFEALND